jgi:hypothetical protein
MNKHKNRTEKEGRINDFLTVIRRDIGLLPFATKLLFHHNKIRSTTANIHKDQTKEISNFSDLIFNMKYLFLLYIYCIIITLSSYLFIYLICDTNSQHCIRFNGITDFNYDNFLLSK